MRFGKYQAISGFLGLVLIVTGFIVIQVVDEPTVLSPGASSQQAAPASQLEVRDAVGIPGSTSELLQGAASEPSQSNQSSQIEQPSEDLLQYLQPNSGQSSFNAQDSPVQ